MSNVIKANKKKSQVADDMVRVISGKGQITLNEMYLADFHHGRVWKGGNGERWFNIVLDFLSIRGDEVIPRAVREQEERIMMAGKSQEYMAALTEVVDSASCRTEYDKAVLILTASVDERIRALSKIFEGEGK